jgi:ribosomal silencing factor RsfS
MMPNGMTPRGYERFKMSTQTMYRQCKFQKGNQIQTAWVENKPGLKRGAEVELKSDNHERWTVIDMGDVLHPADRVQELASDHKTQRRASDI